jgi:hypothetical protein
MPESFPVPPKNEASQWRSQHNLFFPLDSFNQILNCFAKQSHMNFSRLFVFGLGLGLLLPTPAAVAKSVSVKSAAGITAQLDEASGRYEIRTRRPDWKFAGDLGQSARNVVVANGTDRLGAYQEIRFNWQTNVLLAGGIRIYDVRPVALLTLECDRPVEKLPAVFPRFTSAPAGLHHFSFKNDVFSPPSFKLEPNGTPWLFFDDQDHAAIISPAANFMIASMSGDGVHEIASGLNANVRDLPAHFQHATLLAFGDGINSTWGAWGAAFSDLVGRNRPANDVDAGLRYLGYWTDNGAFYYYHYDPALGYIGTLEALVRHYREREIPIRYLQLDSWWYYKTLTDPDGNTGRSKNSKLPEGEWNRYGGLMKYEAHPALFPDGLAAFQKEINLPLITHNRWIDPASPYHAQFAISGFAGVDPLWWQKIMNYIADSGVACYEQDWLNIIYTHSPELSATVGAGDAFTGGMAAAAKARGLSLQYCMVLPRLFLQGARYDNLTTIRVSDDRLQRSRWDDFIYTSRLASAVGIWPWSDVFMSTETNNLLIAALSAGMVGVGDAIGTENKENLLRVARPDGVLVKPDKSLLPLDEVYLAEASGHKSPMVAWTYSDHGPLRTAYLFAYNRQETNSETGFTPTALGFKGKVCVLNTRSGVAQTQSAGKRFAFTLNPEETAYYLVTPVGQSGLAFFGDEGKYVSNGHQRIAALEDAPGRLTVTVTFAAGEKSVHLFGYAKKAPTVAAQSGSAGTLTYDAGSGRFNVKVSPAAAIIAGQDPTQGAVVTFTGK